MKIFSIIKSIFILKVLYISSICNAQVEDIASKHETFTIHSTILNENRIINVWIPDTYKDNLDEFPVMYMLDGGIKEDFSHVANTLISLIELNKIKPIILVGIENTQRRRDLSGFTEVEKDKTIAIEVGGSEKFRNFIQLELFPQIDKLYNTSKHKTIIGESLAGLFVIETFLLKPELFDNYIAFDPSLWWNNHYLVRNLKQLRKRSVDSDKSLWFASSNAKDIVKYSKKLSKFLATENANNLRWKFQNEPKEKHTTIFRATKEQAIIWMFNP